MKIDSLYALSPAPVLDIASTMFPRDRTDDVESSLGVRASGPLEERAGKPSQYQLAPISIAQVVHIIYLISPAK